MAKIDAQGLELEEKVVAINRVSKTVTYDSAYGELPEATRTGYTFIGWYTGKTDGDEIKEDTIVRIT